MAPRWRRSSREASRPGAGALARRCRPDPCVACARRRATACVGARSPRSGSVRVARGAARRRRAHHASRDYALALGMTAPLAPADVPPPIASIALPWRRAASATARASSRRAGARQAWAADGFRRVADGLAGGGGEVCGAARPGGGLRGACVDRRRTRAAGRPPDPRGCSGDRERADVDRQRFRHEPSRRGARSARRRASSARRGRSAGGPSGDASPSSSAAADRPRSSRTKC